MSTSAVSINVPLPMLMTHEPLLQLPDRFILRRVLGWLLGRVLPSLLVAPFVVPFVAPTVALLLTVGFTAPSLAQEPVFSNDGMIWEGPAGDAAAAAQGAANKLDQDRAVLALDAALNLDEHSQLILAEPDADEVARRMAPGNSPAKDAYRQAQQTGFAREVQGFEQLQPGMAGTRRSGGGQDYAVSQRLVGSAGAASIRLHFSGVHLPPGARLHVYGLADDGGQHSTQHNTQQKSYDNAWLGDRTSFWSHSIPGDRAVVEYHALLDNGTTGSTASYTVDRVVHNVVDIFGRDDDGATSTAADTCNLDMCNNRTWRQVGNGVVRLTYIKGRFSFVCSGALLNDQADSGTPYIYTANHCISTQRVASTAEIEYFYQRNRCSDNPARNRVTRLRSTLLATGGSELFGADFTLLRANSAAPNGVALLGWTTDNINVGTRVTSIHHPAGDFKRISFGSKIRDGRARHRVQWTRGVTEVGSSGSPLIINGPARNSARVIGSLYGGASSCRNPRASDVYGKFSVAWPSFQPFLEHGAVPDLAVDTLSVTNITPAVGVSFTINATVWNWGGTSAATTLRYVRSDDDTITADDTEIATDAVEGLMLRKSSPESATVMIADAGVYWVGACVNPPSGETETDNNCTIGARVTVTAPPVTTPALPDLTVDNLSASDATPQPGASFTINATARNLGTETSEATTLSYYRSTDSTISTGDTQLATDTVGALAPDGFSSESTTISIANTGSYWIGACVSPVNGETATGNNCSSGVQVTVTAPPAVVPTLPDLTVDNVSVSNASVETGASFTINATARNSGNGASAATTLRYYRSSNSIISTNDSELTTDAVSALAAGGSSQESATVSIPDAGTWWVGACVSTVNGETTINNNCSTSVQVTVSAPPVVVPTLPDLTVDNVSVSNASVETGGSFTINATARNTGTGASAATTLRYYRSTNNTITTTDTPIGTDAVGGLSAGGSSRESTTVSITIARTWWVGACVEAVSSEVAGTNNCSTAVQVTVTAPPVVVPTLPDLTVDNVSVSNASVETGDSFTINATARNSGNGASAATTLRYYRSTNNTITTDDSELTTDAVGALAAGGSSQENAVVSITNTGTWWVGACVGTVTGETETNNNCSVGVEVTVTVPALPDLTVDSVSVSASTVETDVSFTINATARNPGTGTSAATTLRYFRSDDATITTADTEVATDPVGPLAPGGSAQQNAVVAITETGTWWVGACISTVNDETETGNNCSDGVQVTVTAPDLIVDSISVAESSVEADAAFTINATVQNQGTAASVATTLHYYGSDDSTITASDTQLATRSVEVLVAGMSSPQSAEVLIADAGTYWVGACVAEVNNEIATDNNCSAGVQVTVTERPDNNDRILPAIIQLLLLP